MRDLVVVAAWVLLLIVVPTFGLTVLFWLFRRPIYRFDRRTSRIEPGLRRQVIELPVIATIVGVTVGLAVSMVDRGSIGAAAMLVFTAIVLVFVTGAGLATPRAMSATGRLVLVRQELAELERRDWRRSLVGDRAEASRRLRLLARVGMRLADRGRAMTFRRWLTVERRRLVPYGYGVLFVLAVLVAAWILVRLAHHGPASVGWWGWVLVASPALGSIQLSLWWWLDRHVLLLVAVEIRRDAESALDRISSVAPQPFRTRLRAAVELLLEN